MPTASRSRSTSCVILLVGVFLFGVKVMGHSLLASARFYPAYSPPEVMKIAMPLMLAWYFHKFEGALRLRHYLGAAILLFLPSP